MKLPELEGDAGLLGKDGNLTVLGALLIEVISELPLLLKLGFDSLGGVEERVWSNFPSLLILDRSEFHNSKFEGGKNGGITAFNFSLGSLANGEPFFNMVASSKSSLSVLVFPRPLSLE